MKLRKDVVNLIGRRFGRLRVLKFADRLNGHIRWECVCDCGKKHVTLGCLLRIGKSKSCGCRKIKHGCARDSRKTREYRIWAGMISRCESKSNKAYKNYGKRGIKICLRWQKSFALFLKDMGKCPSKQLSINRIDNNGPYSPSNCCWASRSEQMRNTRRNRWITFQGKTQCLQDWAKQLKLSFHTLTKRIKKWGVKRALTTSKEAALKNRITPHRRFLTVKQHTLSLTQWARKHNLCPTTISHRIRDGWSVERAVTTPSMLNQYQYGRRKRAS